MDQEIEIEGGALWASNGEMLELVRVEKADPRGCAELVFSDGLTPNEYRLTVWDSRKGVDKADNVSHSTHSSGAVPGVRQENEMSNPYRIRTDREYILALRELFAYASTKGTIARAEGWKNNGWELDARAIDEIYLNMRGRPLSNEGEAELFRGGVGLVGKNEAEQRAEYESNLPIKTMPLELNGEAVRVLMESPLKLPGNMVELPMAAKSEEPLSVEAVGSMSQEEATAEALRVLQRKIATQEAQIAALRKGRKIPAYLYDSARTALDTDNIGDIRRFLESILAYKGREE
jgi:hypothetical protein